MIVNLYKTRFIFISYQVVLMKSGNKKMRNISTELKFLLQTPLMLQLSQLETRSSPGGEGDTSTPCSVTSPIRLTSMITWNAPPALGASGRWSTRWCSNSHAYQLHPDRDAGRLHHGRMDAGHGHANKKKLEQIGIASKEQQVIESMKRR